jgi:hypothetical protein
MDLSLNRIKHVIESAHDIRQETKDLINNLITNPSTPVPLLECHKEGKRDNVKTVEVKKTNKSKDKKKEKKEKKQLKNIEISESESSGDHLKKKRKRSASTSSTPSKKVKHDRHVVNNETTEEKKLPIFALTEFNRRCNVCTRWFDIKEFVRADMKSCQQCSHCRKERNTKRKREIRHAKSSKSKI